MKTHLLILILTALLTACGQKGPLQRPSEVAAAAAASENTEAVTPSTVADEIDPETAESKTND